MKTYRVRREGVEQWDDVEAVSVYDAVTNHVKESWVPMDDDLIEYEVQDALGNEWTATVDVEMEPHFDVMCERKRKAASNG